MSDVMKDANTVVAEGRVDSPRQAYRPVLDPEGRMWKYWFEFYEKTRVADMESARRMREEDRAFMRRYKVATWIVGAIAAFGALGAWRH